MTKFCTNCGQEIDGRRKKCIYCGKDIKSDKSIINHDINKETKVENSAIGKSRVLAGITAILFGYLGVHNLYFGFNSKGIAQLLITLLSFGNLYFISAIWALFDAFMLFSRKINIDGYGNPLSF